MRASRQAAQLGGRISGVHGLAEDLVLQDHLGVGPQHHRARGGDDFQQAGTRLLTGDAADIIDGRLVGLAVFGDVEVYPAEREPQAGQQFGTARGLGCPLYPSRCV